MSDIQTFRVIIAKDDEGTFTAQCLEYDIFAQGKNEEMVKNRFAKQIEFERQLSSEANGLDFDGIPPAPDCFHNMWEAAIDIPDGDSTQYRMYG